jgi:hypothetical protein
MKKVIVIVIMTFFLTSCGGIGGVATGGPNIDFNVDIEAIGLGIEKFEENSSTSGTTKTLEDFRVITENNDEILNEIEAATESFLSNIERASSSLPIDDSIESPSKSKLLAWAEGYKSWVYFQRQNQVIGEECLRQSTEWMNCLILNLPSTMQNETSSTIKLKAAIQGIQEWRQLAGQ